eukprot:6180230-Pleurochrysis_carterae.AAC.2
MRWWHVDAVSRRAAATKSVWACCGALEWTACGGCVCADVGGGGQGNLGGARRERGVCRRHRSDVARDALMRGCGGGSQGRFGEQAVVGKGRPSVERE